MTIKKKIFLNGFAVTYIISLDEKFIYAS